MNKGAEAIYDLGVIFFFSPLAYTSQQCMMNPVSHTEGVPMDLKTLKDSQLIAVYRKLREKRDEAKAEFVKAQAPGLKAMTDIEGELLRRMQQDGQNNVSCKGIGVAIRMTDVKIKVENQDEFFKFCLAEHSYEMLDIRAAKKPIEEYIEKHEELPPGLSVTREEYVNIRAPKGG